MEDKDIDQLIVEVRGMLIESGFGWAVEQAETGLFPGADGYWTARSLIDAAEAVSIELAETEIWTMDRLGVEDVDFKPDVNDNDFGDVPAGVTGFRESILEQVDRPRGPQRRAVLEDLAGARSVFEDLRRRLDDNG
jgi:hypothetical protein